MTYFRAELVQLIVSRNDWELEVQRYCMKKNTVTVDSIMLQDELWIKQREELSPNRQSRFLKTEPQKPSFRFLTFEVGSVRFLGNRYPKFSSDSAHPYYFRSYPNQRYNQLILISFDYSECIFFWKRMVWRCNCWCPPCGINPLFATTNQK